MGNVHGCASIKLLHGQTTEDASEPDGEALFHISRGSAVGSNPEEVCFSQDQTPALSLTVTNKLFMQYLKIVFTKYVTQGTTNIEPINRRAFFQQLVNEHLISPSSHNGEEKLVN